MFFGLSLDKVLVIAVIAVFVIGPERLPHYASQLAKLVRTVREMANGAKDRLRDEMGPEFDEVDWKKLDPRQYDPRRIIREALIDDVIGTPTVKPVSATVRPASSAAAGSAAAGMRDKLLASGTAGEAAPFDSEAT